MPKIELDRRAIMAGGSLLTAGLSAGSAAAAPATPAPRIFIAQALPFDPASITGLSAKLLTSHHDSNYAGA